MNFSRGVRLALILWAHVTLLPPSAWALCLGSQGHLAFEPVTACEGAECGADACDASNGDSCVDVTLVRGPVLHSRDAVDAPALVPCIGPALVIASSNTGGAAPSPHDVTSDTPTPTTLRTILRC